MLFAPQPVGPIGGVKRDKAARLTGNSRRDHVLSLWGPSTFSTVQLQRGHLSRCKEKAFT